MRSTNQGTKSVADFFQTLASRVFGQQQPAPVIEKRDQNLAQKRMNIRAVGVRERFQAMRARSDAMAQRLDQFKKNRQPDEAASACDAPEAIETIVLASTPALRGSGPA